MIVPASLVLSVGSALASVGPVPAADPAASASLAQAVEAPAPVPSATLVRQDSSPAFDFEFEPGPRSEPEPKPTPELPADRRSLPGQEARPDPADDPKPAPAPDPSAEPLAHLPHCRVEYVKTTELGASQFGLLEECTVERGDRVKAGDVLGRLFDDDAQVELELQTFQAENNIEVRISEARRDQAQAKLRASELLRRRDALSPEEYNLQQLEAMTAELSVEEAKYKQKLADLKREQAQALLRQRMIIAPHDGVVVEIYKEPGESVSPNEPILRLVDVDAVRITGHLDVEQAWQVEPGQPVRVALDVGGADLEVESRWFPGKVVFIDPEIDAQTQTCRVMAEAHNPDHLLRAGLEARMEILASKADDATAEADPNPSPETETTEPIPDSEKPAD